MDFSIRQSQRKVTVLIPEFIMGHPFKKNTQIVDVYIHDVICYICVNLSLAKEKV